jgi:hypothetical protein
VEQHQAVADIVGDTVKGQVEYLMAVTVHVGSVLNSTV